MTNLLIAAGIVAVWLGGSIIVNRRHARNLRLLAEQRRTDTFSTFVTSLRSDETVAPVAEQVYRALQAELHWIVPEFPLRPSDELQGILCIDQGELEGIADKVLASFGRATEPASTNPYVGRVRTVADLIGFIVAQPATDK